MNAQTKLALQALAIARSTEADEAVLTVYLHTLRDLDASLVSRACERLAKQPRLEYQAALPEVGLIRAEVAKVQREDREAFQVRQLSPSRRDEDNPATWVHCRECSDTSYRTFRCDGHTGERGERDPLLQHLRCGSRHGHAAHTYCERCPCYETNPEIRKSWERMHPQAAKASVNRP